MRPYFTQPISAPFCSRELPNIGHWGNPTFFFFLVTATSPIITVKAQWHADLGQTGRRWRHLWSALTSPSPALTFPTNTNPPFPFSYSKCTLSFSQSSLLSLFMKWIPWIHKSGMAGKGSLTRPYPLLYAGKEKCNRNMWWLTLGVSLDGLWCLSVHPNLDVTVNLFCRCD